MMKTKSYNILQNKSATTETFIINYVFSIKDSECALLQFLIALLEQKGSFYNNPSEMAKAFNALYGSSVQTSVDTMGKLAIVSIKLITPHQKFIGEDVFKSALELLKSFLEDTSEERYEYSMLDAHKNEFIKYAKELENHAIEMGNFQVLSQIEPRAKISKPSYRKISDIKKINLESIKKLHQKMLKGSKYIFAESLSSINKTKKTIFSVFKSSAKTIRNSFEVFDSKEVVESEKVKKDIPQSAGFILYNYPKTSPQAISLFNAALNSELFEVVREQHGYCYYIYSKIITTHNLLLIRAHTSLKHLDDMIELIKKVVEKYSLTEESLTSAKLKRINQLETLLEEPNDSNYFILRRKLLKLNEDVLEEIKIARNATLNEVSKENINLKLISIVKVRGVNDNEN